MPVTLQATSLQWSFTRYTNCNQQLLLLSSYFGTAQNQSLHRLKFTMGQMERGENIAAIHYKKTGDRTTTTSQREHPVRAEDVTIQKCSVSKDLYVITITMLNVAHLLHWSIIFQHNPQNTLTQVKEFCQYKSGSCCHSKWSTAISPS